MKKKIAVFTTGWCAEILSQFVSGMTGPLNDENTDIFLFFCYPTYVDTDAVKKGEMNIFDLPDLRDFDGVVIFASGLDYQDVIDRIIERSKAAGIPVIMQGARRDDVSFVGSDNYQAAKDLCEHLIKDHGVKNITFMAGTRDSYDSEIRLNAVRDYLKENNFEDYLKEINYTNWENAKASGYIHDLCEKNAPLPDAFICANDGIAMVVCIALSDYGYEVPRDILVTGFDNLEDSQIFDPALASVDQCFVEMGAAAVNLWKDLAGSPDRVMSKVIDCKFVPGESCGCFERNSDKLRRRMGREKHAMRSMTTYFNRKLDIIDTTVLACSTYEEFKKNLRALFERDHYYEGDSFHILLEPNFGLSIFDPDIKLNTDGYSRKMEVIFSSEDGKSYEEELFDPHDLVPGYKSEGENHLYVFLPLHEADQAYGYLIFRDCPEKIENKYLQTYKNRMGLVFDKFRYALTLDQINKRLLDLMRKDPLTSVNNRMAYDDKEKHLQAQINSDPDCEFAIAMFDVNSLKLINDSLGHEAGDEYLLRACHLICDVFKHSPVYRMGGDEFIVVLSGEDYKNRDSLMKKINEVMSPYSDTLPLPPDYVSIACGISAFDIKTDVSVTDVSKRADDEMYKDKAAKKMSLS
jgi:diguanylate cyclase (GGDEF)-like protein